MHWFLTYINGCNWILSERDLITHTKNLNDLCVVTYYMGGGSLDGFLIRLAAFSDHVPSVSRPHWRKGRTTNNGKWLILKNRPRRHRNMMGDTVFGMVLWSWYVFWQGRLYLKDSFSVSGMWHSDQTSEGDYALPATNHRKSPLQTITTGRTVESSF